MNNHYIIMVIKKIVETTPNSLNLFEVGELTLLRLSSLTPVSKSSSVKNNDIILINYLYKYTPCHKKH
jgi:hypothetical protein